MATVYLVPVGSLFQALSDSGAVGSGYKLYTYVGGSVSTAQITYTDSTGTVANSNPIILGSNGRFQSVNVWVTAGVTLKLVLTDSSGSAITGGTIDNVPAINSGDSSGITFLQSGTSATTRTVQSKLRESVSVLDFGAKGDGINDDTSAIQAAIDAYPNGLITFPPGTYLVSAPIDKPVGASICGAGRGATRIKMKNAANAAAVIRTSGFSSLTDTTSLGGEFNSELRDLTIDGNKSNNTAGIGIQYYGKYFRIENVAVESCYSTGIYTEYAGGDDFSTPTKTLEAIISKVFVQQCGGTGMFLKGPHDMIVEALTVFSNGNWGIEIITSVHATDVNTYLNTSGGIYVYSIVGAINYIGSIYGTAVVGSTATGVGCYLKSGGNTLAASIFAGPTALQVDANNNIVQGVISGSTNYGLLLSGSSAQGVFDLVMYGSSGVIFGVATASLKSMVRAFMGDATGTLQNGAFPGTWQINGYTGFTGSNHQMYGGVAVLGGRLTLPTTSYGSNVPGLFYDTSAPVSGSFQRGDRVFNSAPSVGQPKSWACTVTGSPGTWVSEGNL